MQRLSQGVPETPPPDATTEPGGTETPPPDATTEPGGTETPPPDATTEPGVPRHLHLMLEEQL